MERDQIRLECIKIAHSHGRPGPQTVEIAKVYEEYIVDTSKANLKTDLYPKDPKKNVRQPSILD